MGRWCLESFLNRRDVAEIDPQIRGPLSRHKAPPLINARQGPQELPAEEPGSSLLLIAKPRPSTLTPLILRFFHLLWKSVWRAFQHDAFAIAKASAYSSILTFFPTLLVVGSVLGGGSRTMRLYSREISYALERILPAGISAPCRLICAETMPVSSVGVLVTTSLLTLWLASGAIISWMEGFRRCYELPENLGLGERTTVDRVFSGNSRGDSFGVLDDSGRLR